MPRLYTALRGPVLERTRAEQSIQANPLLSAYPRFPSPMLAATWKRALQTKRSIISVNPQFSPYIIVTIRQQAPANCSSYITIVYSVSDDNLDRVSMRMFHYVYTTRRIVLSSVSLIFWLKIYLRLDVHASRLTQARA